MQRVQVLAAFSVAMILAGVALFMPDLFTHLPQFNEPQSGTTAASILVLLGAVSGMIAMRTLRLQCNRLRDHVQQSLDSEQMRPLEAADRVLAPLVQAINRMVAVLDQRQQDAKRKVRELEIQLRVVQLEREHAESIIHSISDAVLVTDPWDELVLANESASRALGFKLPDQGRRPVDQVLTDAKLISFIREMRASRSSGGRRIIEHRVKADDGDRTFKVTLSCLGNGNSRAEGSGVVAVMHDMTREAEVAQMKNDFVSHVSHELRTPLASIKAYTEMLIDGEAVDDKQRSEFYDVIQNEANRLGRLIDNILDISRIESGLVKINKQPLSLTVVIKEALEIIIPQATGKQIAIREQVAPAMHQVMADKDMMHRVVLNLLSNAVKYTHEKGQITVTTLVDESAKTLTVQIQDTGVGIPPKDLPFVFDKFYRVEANSRMAKGTGLGLSLVKHIVEAVHHGRVFVESTVGKGSRFGVELPLC